MARTPVLAAGGIVLRQAETPLIAVVRLRKRDEWVLPKGKLDDGETPRAAAEREVLEETGHKVSVQEFLGTMVYQSGGRSKLVHYRRMKASGGPVRELMRGCRADRSRRFCRRSARSHSRRWRMPRLRGSRVPSRWRPKSAAAAGPSRRLRSPSPRRLRAPSPQRLRSPNPHRPRRSPCRPRRSPCRLRRSPYRIACRSPRMRVPPLQMASSKPSQRWRQWSPWSRRPLP